MPRETFRQDYQRDEVYNVSGEWLNMAGRALNGEGSNERGTGVDVRRGAVTLRSAPQALVWGIAQVVDAADDCEELNGATLPPCKKKHLYVCRFRFYDAGLKIWNELEDDLRLDAGAYWEGLTDGEPATDVGSFDTEASKTPAGGPSYGSIPRYRPGDMVPAIYDDQRGMLVPLHSPPDEPTFGEFQTKSATRFANATEATAYVEAIVQVKKGLGPSGGVLQYDYWRDHLSLCWRTPVHGVSWDAPWYDSRSGSVVVRAGQRTGVRVSINNQCRGDIDVTECRVRITALARIPEDAEDADVAASPSSPYSGSVQDGWSITQQSGQGRFWDEPRFSIDEDHPGEFLISFADEKDEWVVRIDVFAVIQPADIESSTSRSSTSSSGGTSSSGLTSTSSSGGTSSASASSVSSVTLSTGGLDPCLYGLGGVPIGTGQPSYLLGIGSDGCLAWFPVGDCDESSGSSGGSSASSASSKSSSTPSSASSKSSSSRSSSSTASSASSASSASTGSSVSTPSSASSFSSSSHSSRSSSSSISSTAWTP